jgi:hypothetical protein
MEGVVLASDGGKDVDADLLLRRSRKCAGILCRHDCSNWAKMG